MKVHSISEAGEAVAVIKQALADATSDQSSRLVLQVAAEIRLGREAGDILEAGLRQTPSIAVLEIRSASPAIHFLASTIALRLPTLRVEVTKPTQPIEPVDEKPRLVVSDEAEVESTEDLDSELERIFDRAVMRGSTHLELTFPADEPLPIGISNKLEPHLRRSRLRGLTLVHPSIVTGFVVSTLRLRFRRMQIDAENE